MTDGMGPYVVPSLIVGLGAWGGAVAAAAEAELKARSPALARACRALALDAAAPDLSELLRAHLRVSRMAEVIRALELEGLMRLDPVVAPATHVYFVATASDMPVLRDVAVRVDEAAAELKAKVVKAAIVDVSGVALPKAAPGFPVYAIEPVTAHGLVLGEAEYRAAAVELLIAAAQPGGSQILAGGRGTGTLGVAWLSWSPQSLLEAEVPALPGDALHRCMTAAAPANAKAPPLTEGRNEALLKGLPFTTDLEPEGALWGQPTPRRLRRAAAVLDRKLERWAQRIGRQAAARREQEAAALREALDQALTAGPDGLARMGALLDATARDAALRPNRHAPTPPEPRRALPLRTLLRRLTAAESLPDTPVAALALGAGLAIFTLIWWLAGGKALSWVGGTAFQLLACGGYLLWRPWRIRRALKELDQAMTYRAAAVVREARVEAIAELDEATEQLCAVLRQRLNRLPADLKTLSQPTEARNQREGALCFPLVDPEASGPIRQELQQLVPDLSARLASAGVLLHWQDPRLLLREAEAEVRRALAQRRAPDPAQAATRAYGDRLAQRLQDLVDRLQEWAQPLLARPLRLPEGRRWLLWPEGLPCPPVPPDVTLLPYAKSSIAVIHVIAGLPATGERKSEETA